jgi:steroid delta-isomerase-like uncharacterized protein
MVNNRDLISQCLAAFNLRDVDAASAVVAEDLVNHSARPEAQGRAGLFAVWKELWTAFPDLAWTCEDVVAEGDRVVCRTRMRGLNSGSLRLTLMPLPATGRAFDGETIYIFRVADGRIAELWAQRDEVGMLRQLGHLTLAGARS